jgi:hypothetical protein
MGQKRLDLSVPEHVRWRDDQLPVIEFVLISVIRQSLGFSDGHWRS